MQNLIITIGREVGTGGATIGKDLASKLGIKYYNKELIAEAAKRSGLHEEVFKDYDEKPTASLLYNIVMNTYASWSVHDYNLPVKVFQVVIDTIKELAEQGSCVFIGRCADYALADEPNVLSIFITAPEEYRVNHVMKKYGYSRENAIKLIRQKNKERKTYYEDNTGKEWGAAFSYNLCIDVSKMDEDRVVDFIIEYIDSCGY